MGLFSNKSEQQILRDEQETFMAAHKARKEGRRSDARALDARLKESRKEMEKRYKDEVANPEAALLVRRWASK